MKTQEIDLKQAALEQQLEQLKSDRVAAEKAERDAKHSRLVELQSEAADYRSQSADAANDTEKKNLYRYAADADKQANQIRLELGLELNPEPEPEPEPEVDQTEQLQRVRGQRAVNSLLLVAICAGLSYAFTDYTAGQIEAGILSFLLVTVARISYAVASVFAASWLVLRLIAGFAPDYVYTRVKDDFLATKPVVRLWLMAIVAASILLYLSTLAHVE